MTMRRLTWRPTRAPEFASVIDASGTVRVVPWLEWAGLVHDNLFGPDAAFGRTGNPNHINDLAQLAYLVARAIDKVSPGVEGLAAWLAEMSRASGYRNPTVQRIYEQTVADPDAARAFIRAWSWRRALVDLREQGVL